MEEFLANLETWIGIGLLVAVLCVGATFAIPLMLLLSAKNARLRRETRNWPSTTGRVLVSRVVNARTYFYGKTPEEVEQEWARQDAEVPVAAKLAVGILSGDVLDPFVPAGVERAHYPMVLYEYHVNGTRFTSFSIRADERGDPKYGGTAYSRKVVQRYPLDSMVTVYYNPQKPRDSCLER